MIQLETMAYRPEGYHSITVTFCMWPTLQTMNGGKQDEWKPRLELKTQRSVLYHLGGDGNANSGLEIGLSNLPGICPSWLIRFEHYFYKSQLLGLSLPLSGIQREIVPSRVFEIWQPKYAPSNRPYSRNTLLRTTRISSKYVEWFPLVRIIFLVSTSFLGFPVKLALCVGELLLNFHHPRRSYLPWTSCRLQIFN